MNNITCIVCGYEKHYTHFPLQDFDLMIIPLCSTCLATAAPNRGWGESMEEAINKARRKIISNPSRYDFTKASSQ